MSDLSNRVESLVGEIKALEAQLAQKRADLKSLTGELRDLQKTVMSLSGQRVLGTSGAKVGRPKGSAIPDGELSVSQQVLNYLQSVGETGATRADLLANVPEVGKDRRDSAVHAAIRQHQVTGKIFNKDHKWYFNPAAVAEVVDTTADAPHAVDAVTE